MVKTRLLLGAAIAAFGIIPVAQADQVDVTQTASWDNSVDVSLSWDVDISKFLNIDGSISISGEVDADALAHATLDDKQIVDGNSVQFEDYQNAYQDWSTEGSGAEPGLGQGPGDQYFTEEGSPQGPALYTNTVTAGDGTLSNASGNIGLNMAAGDYNVQENAAVIASAESLVFTAAAEPRLAASRCRTCTATASTISPMSSRTPTSTTLSPSVRAWRTAPTATSA